MRRVSNVVAMILFMVSFVAGATFMSTPATAAQLGPGSRVLANGQVLTWSDFYELDPSTVAVVDGVEFIDLYSATGWFNVITTNFPAYGNVLRDLSVQDLQLSVPLRQVDRGDYSNVSYSLDTTNYQGVEVGIFTLVLDQGRYAQLTMVVAPVETFQYELQIAKQELTIGGAGVFQGVDPIAMQGHLTRTTGVALVDLNATTTTVVPVNQANTGQTTTAQTTQPANTAQTTSPPVAATSSVVVGSSQVGWSGTWTQDTASSSPTQATFSRIDQASGSIELVSYGEFSDPSVLSSAAAIDGYADAFFQSAGATGVQQVDGGVLSTGSEWKLYRFNLQGIDLATYVSASKSASGAWVVTTVTGNAPLLMLTLIEVQTQFSINGTTSLLNGVDPVLVSLRLYQ